MRLVADLWCGIGPIETGKQKRVDRRRGIRWQSLRALAQSGSDIGVADEKFELSFVKPTTKRPCLPVRLPSSIGNHGR